jgi:hypothetical protein
VVIKKKKKPVAKLRAEKASDSITSEVGEKRKVAPAIYKQSIGS